MIDDARSVEDLRPYLLQYLPEGLYYDRNAYVSLAKARRQRLDYAHAWRSPLSAGQDLTFDIDPENTECPVHGSVEDKMRRCQGLSFCEWEFSEARRQAGELHDRLEGEWDDLAIVHSRRGFHIHVRVTWIGPGRSRGRTRAGRPGTAR